MVVTIPGYEKMVVKSLDLRLCLFTWCLLTLKVSMLTSSKLRNGETRRYVYNNSLGYEMYCHYCPQNLNIFESEDANRKYQVKICVNKNYPLQEKLDQEERDNKLYPFCLTGTIPSCPLPEDPAHGSWVCNVPENADKVPVYKTCTQKCNPGYKSVEEKSIYCNESRKWDPSGETACIKASACPVLVDPEHGRWNCNNTTKGSIPYESCHVQCDDNYVLEGGKVISCNNTDMKWTPSYSSMACVPKIGSEVFPCLALYVSSAVGVLICVLVTIICCRRKNHQRLDCIFSRMESGIKQSPMSGNGESDKNSITVTSEKLETTALKQDSEENTPVEDTHAYTDVDSSSIEPLLPIKTVGDNQSSHGKKAVEHEDQPSDANEENGASNDKLNTDEDTDIRRDADRPGPEGQSFSINGGSKPPVLPPGGSASNERQKKESDPEETFSKEFERDPTSCSEKAYEDLIQKLEKRHEKRLCEKIVKYFEEMEGHGSYHGFNEDDRRHHAYELMRKKDVRIGHIVYHIYLARKHNYNDVLQQIRKIHPDCNFCKSLYGDVNSH